VPGLELLRAVGMRGIRPVLLGGVSYTVGGVVDLARWPVLIPQVLGPHEIFHVLVMLGTWFHVVFMIQYVIPFQRAMPTRRYAVHMTDLRSHDAPRTAG